MPVSQKEYQRRVKLICTPMPGSVVHHLDGGLGDGTLFWLHTLGMSSEFGRPDLEMLNVPAAFIGDAGCRLNHWAHYSIEHEIKAGETVREGETPFHPLFELVPSENTDFWKAHPCLRLQVRQVAFACDCCGGVPPEDPTQ